MSAVRLNLLKANVERAHMKTKKQLSVTIGENILKYRNLRHLTQENLAEMADIASAYLAQIENGNRTASTCVIYKLAEALEVNAGALMYEECENSIMENIRFAMQDMEVEQLSYFEEFVMLYKKHHDA